MALISTQNGTLSNMKDVPVKKEQEDVIDELPRRKTSMSRVRKISKRLSATFRWSFALPTDETVTHNEKSLKQVFPDESKVSRGASLENLLDRQQVNVKTRSQSVLDTHRHHAYSTADIPHLHDNSKMHRVVSLPSTTKKSAYPYGRLDQYTKLEQLGEGSYATVYKGLSKLNNIFVALKEIRLQAEEGIPFTAIREASLLKDLKHTNIVTLHDIIPTKEHLVLVFEYLHTDLCSFLEERPLGVNPNNAKLMLFQLLRGLNYIHKKQILHRDIKPQNILLSDRGELKLADFGLARAKSVPSHTYTNEIVTLWYRPPDVLLGSTNYTTSLDIWGVGCIFVEMVSGFPLFPGVKSAEDQLLKIFKIRGTPSIIECPSLRKYKIQSFGKSKISSQAPRLASLPNSEDLAEGMLQVDPKLRVTAEEAMRHAYFGDFPPSIHTLADHISILSIAGLKIVNDRTRVSSGRKKSITRYFV